ncbi:helix-turn-helix domain-containing protein [Thalassoroseus pseudoceratinae]|uniref:helix-turn-helix domain-containing protein n=1 Tax=Thalassoroseus pseudoceratinae TaxID=2713176 RepID=UPI00141E7662|nr:helix-turn-helix domain-containing protein [Thalassoroseus pseudoceratinae]
MSERNENATMPLLVDEPTAAEMLSISPRKLWGLADAGEIPCLKVGRLKRYAVRDLLAWIEANTKGGDQ